jgi:hypothetical protein
MLLKRGARKKQRTKMSKRISAPSFNTIQMVCLAISNSHRLDKRKAPAFGWGVSSEEVPRGQAVPVSAFTFADIGSDFHGQKRLKTDEFEAPRPGGNLLQYGGEHCSRIPRRYRILDRPDAGEIGTLLPAPSLKNADERLLSMSRNDKHEHLLETYR